MKALENDQECIIIEDKSILETIQGGLGCVDSFACGHTQCILDGRLKFKQRLECYWQGESMAAVC